MKNRIIGKIIFTYIFILVSGTISCQESSVEYLAKISTILDKSKDEMFSYLRAITTGKSAKKIDNKRVNLINQINVERAHMRVAGDYNGDASLKDAGLKYLDIQKHVLSEDYGKIVDMEEIAEKSYDNMEQYLNMQEAVNEKLQTEYTSFEKIYNDFAAANDITLVKEELDKKSKRIAKMSKVIHSYNELFLIQFKCVYQEKLIQQAIKEEDVNAIQQNINAQITQAEGCLVKLDSIDPYQNDFTAINKTRNFINFFKKEAGIDFTKQLDFFIKKDNFEKIKKNFDSKSKEEKDKEAVDEYNNAVNEYNAATKSYNEMNNRLNKERSEQYDGWNRVMDDFMVKHSK